MKIIRCIFVILMVTVLSVNCYAQNVELKASPEYQGVETTDIELDCLGEYDIADFSLKTGVKGNYAACYQIRTYNDLIYIKKIFDIKGIKFSYGNFQDNWLLISFGAKIENIKYYSNKGCYSGKGTDCAYEVTYDNDVNLKKAYVYKTDKIKLRRTHSHAPLLMELRENAKYIQAEIVTDEEYTNVELSLVKSGIYKLNILNDYSYLKDIKGRMPQLGEVFEVNSNAEYQRYDQMFGLPSFLYNKYKDKCIIVSLGCELEGLRVYNDRVEPIPTGEYVNKGIFIYETDSIEPKLKRQIFVSSKEQEKKLPESFLESENRSLSDKAF